MTAVTPEWVKDAVFYQIFPDRFARSDRLPKPSQLEPWETPPTTYGFKGGDLLGVVEHLDYLRDMEVTAISLNPVFASAANHRYHTYDYFTVDPLLGGNAALRELLAAAHGRGIRVILDGVFNHASRGFWQFHHVLENGARSPYVDWFFFDPDRLTRKKHFAPYPDPQTEAALQRGADSYEAVGYRAWWNQPALPKFNVSTSAVREFLWGVATHWVAMGIDGWRIDVPEEINDADFWRELRRRVKATNPDAYLLGEIWHEARGWLEGDRFDAAMNYPFAMACLGFFGGENLDLAETHRPGGYAAVRPLNAEEFANSVDWMLGLYAPSVTQAQFNLLSSHDTPRFLTCLRGDRTGLLLAMLFMFTYPGVPCLYYGDEVGLEGGHDPDCRRSFPWNPSFWDREILSFVKQCAALRRTHPALRRGSYQRVYAANGVYAFRRDMEADSVLVALNTAAEARRIALPAGTARHLWLDAWSGARRKSERGIIYDLEIASRSGVVLIGS
jgi:cyclomaltodextrinase / maltogenic alpha-amylase / neopullulanase